MKLCAITDRLSLSQPAQLLDLAESWAAGGVDFIQLREKDLPVADLQSLAQQVKARIAGSQSKLLINHAVPGVADGVHLAGKLTPGAAATVRRQFPGALVSVPCHSLEDVRIAVAERVDLLLFSPVFEKLSAAPQGLDALHQACVAAMGIPVFALGGVTSANAPACIAAGAAGVAGIRLFASGDWRRLHDI
jgi:thiamine-phosphate pyrophosphorylase